MSSCTRARTPTDLLAFVILGKSFSTPEAVLVRSGEGLGGMSRTLHRLFLDNLIPRSWADKDPPVLLNTWEAKYFHVNHANVVEMTKQVCWMSPCSISAARTELA